jgi:hypothetical protein
MPIKYPFTADGVHAFLTDVICDCLDHGEYHNIVISYGDRKIEIPMFPETYGALEQFLPEAEQLYYEEYETED